MQLGGYYLNVTIMIGAINVKVLLGHTMERHSLHNLRNRGGPNIGAVETIIGCSFSFN